MSGRPSRPDGGPWAQSITLAFRVAFGIVLAMAFAWPFSNLRQVPADSRAVVVRLGRVVRVQGAGLLLAWPRPIERVALLPAPERQLQVSFDPLKPSAEAGDAAPSWAVSRDVRQNAAFFMTADGVVHLTAALFYKITDPSSYMPAAAHVLPALEASTMASLVSLLASRDTDTLVATRNGADLSEGDRERRERLRVDLVAAVNRRLAALRDQGMDLGVEVSRIDLVTALPNEAKVAFEEVLIAGQQADAMVADARSQAVRIEQQGRQDADQLLARAKAAAAERTSVATAHAATILALARAAGGASRAGLLTNLYNDRMAAILGKARSVDAFDPANGARLLLPEQGP